MLVNEMIMWFMAISFSMFALVFTQFYLVNFLMKGFIWTYLKVKFSRGKKILAQIHSMNDVYYRTGKFDATRFLYKDRNKIPCSFACENKSMIYQTLGVAALDIDEVTNNVWDRKGAIIAGNDPQLVDSLINRALMSPEAKSLLVMLLIVCLCIFIVFVLAQLGFDYYLYIAIKDLAAARGVI